jgi:hypothetical protein
MIFSILKICFIIVSSLWNSPVSFRVYSEEIQNSGLLQSVTYPDSDELTKAVIKGDLKLVKVLIEGGTSYNTPDIKGWTALDYAKKYRKPAIEEYLISIGAKTYSKPLKNFFEGPHIRISDDDKVNVVFLKHDSITQKSSINKNVFRLSDLPKRINGIDINSEDLDFKNAKLCFNESYYGVKKIFVVGDVHGEYDRVFSLLKNVNIIDKKGKWKWGSGHLVFMGDIFDRGSKVTEMLWCIFSLSKQAEKAGGKVHLLLGNHEQMIFKNDIRYVNDNYFALCENLSLSYTELFGDSTILGHWLRQKPVMVKINNYVFVHAGLSPTFFEMRMAIDSVNKLVWQFLNNEESEINSENRIFILSSKGILWYRGFINYGSDREVIDRQTLLDELEFYKARAFIVGHTEVDSISGFYDYRVIDVNIPKADNKIREQGLLIEDDRMFVVYGIKDRKELKPVKDY